MLQTQQLSDIEAVKEIAKRLVDILHPQFIYFFGSRARGDYEEWSDYDLMVIVDDGTPETWRDPGFRTQVLANLQLKHDDDIKVWKRHKFEGELHLRASLASAVMRQGQLLYARPDAQTLQATSSPVVPCVGEGEPPAYDPVLLQHTIDWLQNAQNDVLIARLCIHNPSNNLLDGGLFHCQQAVEKAFKAFLTWHDLPPSKTHKFADLVPDCVKLDPSLQTLVDQASWLSEWSLLGRYRGDAPAPTKQQGKDALCIAESMLAAILKRVPSSIQSKIQGRDR